MDIRTTPNPVIRWAGREQKPACAAGGAKGSGAGQGSAVAPAQARCAAMTSPRWATASSITAGEWVTKLRRIVERSALSA